jgi:hypothetical protein
LKPSATAPENEKVADPVHGDKTDDAARWWRAYQLAENDQVDELRRLAAAGDDHARRQLADHDLLDELRDRISAGGGHYALRRLARRLIERDMSEELRELVEAADADTRPLILDAAGGASSTWMNAMRVLADFGHKASGMYLARTLAREGRLEELRQRAGNGDEYARYWLDEALGRLACGSSVAGKEHAVAGTVPLTRSSNYSGTPPRKTRLSSN